jgi:hypothetical protein
MYLRENGAKLQPHPGGLRTRMGGHKILEESGFLPTDPIGLICLAGIPRGLDEAETRMYLRENGALRQGLRSLIRVDSGAWWAQDA